MIRTNVVELTVIPAFAYRQKLQAGGSGIVILRKDADQPGLASISTKTGEPIPAKNTPKKLYPDEAFKEAMELTRGMPYKKQGNVVLNKEKLKEVKEDVKEETAEEILVNSEDYQKIVDHYTDKNGKLSYDLLNKDMIRFLHSSSIARRLVGEMATPAKIRLYTTGTKFRNITGNHDMSDKEVKQIIEMLDEVYPKGVLKDFNEEVKKSLKGAKK